MNMPEISISIRTSFGPLLIALLCGFTAGPSRGASLMFRVPTYQVAEGDVLGTAIAAGDFNGDGRSDLAVGASSEIGTSFMGRVLILLGRDDGTFGPPIQAESADCPVEIVMGDFDGDEHHDTAVATAPARHP